MNDIIKRAEYEVLTSRINELRKFIQVIVGPRQVGKTTMVTQVIENLSIPYKFYSAEGIFLTENWLESIWQSARQEIMTQQYSEMLLVIDEVQKIPNWSERIKQEWDYDTRMHIPLKVVLLGSSRMMIMSGLTESLAGRFEIIHMTHWTYSEMQEAFGWDLNQYIYFGGYPGAADLIGDEDRWRHYVQYSLLETAISTDVLLTSNVYKPALLRQLFVLACAYSSEELSYRKIMGQLQDAGNVTTLANYIQLLNEANLVCGLQKFSRDTARKYSSSPKFQVYNNALLNVSNQLSFNEVLIQPQQWGRLVESAVGAYLINEAVKHNMNVYYWRESNAEVDYIVEYNKKIIAIEVKSNGAKNNMGLPLFKDKFKPHSAFIVGEAGISLDTFLKTDTRLFFQ